MQSLKSGSKPVLTSSNWWSKLAKVPNDSQGSGDRVSNAMPEIFTKVVAAILANSGGKLNEDKCTVDFLQNPSRARRLAERRNESRPDGYLVLKDREKRCQKMGRKRIYSGLALCFHTSTSGMTEVMTRF
jgi:hypothetical protein